MSKIGTARSLGHASPLMTTVGPASVATDSGTNPQE